MQRRRDRLHSDFNTRLEVKNLGSCLHSAAQGPDLKQACNALCLISVGKTKAGVLCRCVVLSTFQVSVTGTH